MPRSRKGENVSGADIKREEIRASAPSSLAVERAIDEYFPADVREAIRRRNRRKSVESAIANKALIDAVRRIYADRA